MIKCVSVGKKPTCGEKGGGEEMRHNPLGNGRGKRKS